MEIPMDANSTRSQPTYAIGVDLGGTKMLVGAVDRNGKVTCLERELTKPEDGTDAVIQRLVGVVAKVRAQVEPDAVIEAVAVGVPGGVDVANGVVDKAPNLRWENVPLAQLLGPLVGAPVVLDNDVRVAVMGEHGYGVGRGAKAMVGVWVGTGLGGGIVIDGRLWQGARGVAGEIGHTIVDPKGPKCPCGNRGCIEALASRTSIERDVRREIRKGVKSGILERMESKGRVQLASSIAAWALHKKDKAFMKVFRRAQKNLGLFTANLVNTLDPEVIVFGGGLAERLSEEFVGRIRTEARKHFLSKRDIERVRIVPTLLGETAPVAGAALLARLRLGIVTEDEVRSWQPQPAPQELAIATEVEVAADVDGVAPAAVALS
jgi:glucokinase